LINWWTLLLLSFGYVMLLFAIAWGVALASLGEMLGFSKEVGAFLAGFSLATSPYREAMSGRLSPVRDFLLLFFFLDLGAKLEFHAFEGQTMAALVLSVFVLIGNPNEQAEAKTVLEVKPFYRFTGKVYPEKL